MGILPVQTQPIPLECTRGRQNGGTTTQTSTAERPSETTTTTGHTADSLKESGLISETS